MINLQFQSFFESISCFFLNSTFYKRNKKKRDHLKPLKYLRLKSKNIENISTFEP